MQAPDLVSSLISYSTGSTTLFPSHGGFNKQFSPQEGEPSIVVDAVLKQLFLLHNTDNLLWEVGNTPYVAPCSSSQSVDSHDTIPKYKSFI